MRRSNLCPRDDLYTLYPSEADGRNVFFDPQTNWLTVTVSQTNLKVTNVELILKKTHSVLFVS